MSRIPPWLVWILGTLLTVVLLAPGIHLARDHFECPSCASTQTLHEWRWGAYGPERSLRLSPRWETVTPSKFHTDWNPTGHDHIWRGSRRSETYAFGIRKETTTSEGVLPPRWLKHYESDEGFRGWIQQRVIGGDLAPSDLLKAAQHEDFALPGRLPNLGDAWHWKYQESLGARH